MDTSTDSRWQTVDLAACHRMYSHEYDPALLEAIADLHFFLATKAGSYDCSVRSRPGVAGTNYIPDEQHELSAAIKIP